MKRIAAVILCLLSLCAARALAGDIFWAALLEPLPPGTAAREPDGAPGEMRHFLPLCAEAISALPGARPAAGRAPAFRVAEIKKRPCSTGRPQTMKFSNGAELRLVTRKKLEASYGADLRFAWRGEPLWEASAQLTKTQPIFLLARSADPFAIFLVIR